MSASNFQASLAFVLQSEGGKVDDPNDPGGRTDAGVTQHIYDSWRHSEGLPLQDVFLITPAEEASIYRSMFWQPVRGDLLPVGIDYITFDAAVKDGPYHAACVLQHALDFSDDEIDGNIGPHTLAAITAADPAQLIHDFRQAHIAYLETRPTWADYHNGYTNRCNIVDGRAEAMLG